MKRKPSPFQKASERAVCVVFLRMCAGNPGCAGAEGSVYPAPWGTPCAQVDVSTQTDVKITISVEIPRPRELPLPPRGGAGPGALPGTLLSPVPPGAPQTRVPFWAAPPALRGARQAPQSRGPPSPLLQPSQEGQWFNQASPGLRFIPGPLKRVAFSD